MTRGLVVLATLLCFFGTDVGARIWYVYFNTGGTLAMTLQPADHTCPDHFRPVAMSAEIQDLREFSLNFVGAEFFAPNKTYDVLKERDPRLIMQMGATGCVFGNHFVLRSGEVAFSGDIVVGRVDDVRFSFPATKNPEDQELSLRYEAYLNNGYEQDSASASVTQQNAALGYLVFSFSWDPTFLADPVREGDQITAGRANIKVLVHPENR